MEEAALLPVLVRSAGGEAEAHLRLPANATVADCKRRLANALLGRPKPEAQKVRACGGGLAATCFWERLGLHARVAPRVRRRGPHTARRGR